MTEHPAPAWRRGRPWLVLTVGLLAIGVGVGIMLTAGLGVSPADAMYAGLAQRTGWTVGAAMIASTAVFLLAALALQQRPGPGTVLMLLAVGPVVDVTRWACSGLDVPDWPVSARVAWWALGLVIFAAGVLGPLSSDLGAHPYDQLTQGIATRLGISLGWARVILDGAMITAAFLLGGAWGLGTILLLLAVPPVLARGIPHVRRWTHGTTARP